MAYSTKPGFCELICLANFSESMLDVSIPSSAQNATLLYESYTERIPPLGTAVTIELVPVFKKTPQNGNPEKTLPKKQPKS